MSSPTPEERIARLEANQENHDRLFERLSASLDRLVDRFDKTERRAFALAVVIFAGTGNGATVVKALGSIFA